MPDNLAVLDGNDSVTTESQKYDLAEMWKLRFKHNLSINQIADKMGCSKVTVWRKLEKYINMLPNADEIKSYQEHKSQYLTGLELKVYEEMCNPEKLKDASLNNLAYSFQSLYNANRLESGKSTSNISVAEVNGTIADLQAQADAIRKSL